MKALEKKILKVLKARLALFSLLIFNVIAFSLASYSFKLAPLRGGDNPPPTITTPQVGSDTKFMNQ